MKWFDGVFGKLDLGNENKSHYPSNCTSAQNTRLHEGLWAKREAASLAALVPASRGLSIVGAGTDRSAPLGNPAEGSSEPVEGFNAPFTWSGPAFGGDIAGSCTTSMSSAHI